LAVATAFLLLLTVSQLHFQLLHVNTAAYEAMIALRMRVLLAPIGIPQSYINAQQETTDFLIGAYSNDQLVGCCILTERSATIVQLRQMAVETSWQKKGVGAALLRFAEDLAREKGYQTLMMHARDTVLPFYTKAGYTVSGEPFVEVGIGHHKMEKTLQPLH
jgi:predicted GNAT family N-acyltransferase